MNLDQNTTICAISTAPGVGGIAVARVSGPQAISISDKIWKGTPLSDVPSRKAVLGTVIDAQGEALDQALATVFRAPASFTGQDVVEFSVHGSRYVQQAIIASLIHAGAQLAHPGEFTRRAFSAGKLDLTQAEAVADIIASESKAAHRIVMNQMRGNFSSRLRQLRDSLIDLCSLLELELDFSEEEVEFASREHLTELAHEIQMEVNRLATSFRTGSAIKAGIPVAIIGPTNAGKSSLLNVLLGDDRAIVSDVHGTTRDIVEDVLYIGDYQFRLMDTAGLRQTSDEIESIGIERSRQAAARADIIIYVVDSTKETQISLPATEAQVIVAHNKADLAPTSVQDDGYGEILAKTGEGIANHSSASVKDDGYSEILTKTGEGIANHSSTSVKDDGYRHIDISAKTGEGIDQLLEMMNQIAAEAENQSAGSPLITNARHYEALLQASQAITRALDAMQSGLSGELIAQDTRLTIEALSSIIGDITSTDILSTIFSRFCIGK